MQKKLSIVKVGSSLVVNDRGEFQFAVMVPLLEVIRKEQERGNDVILVSSGAVALGRSILALRNQTSFSRNVAAATGQMALMAAYREVATHMRLAIGEMLVSRPHMTDRTFFLRFQEHVKDLLDSGMLPIFNENDALVTDTDWSFGDNDSLAATLAVALSADTLVILSQVHGLYTGDPSVDKDAVQITEVDDINQELMKYCSDTTSSVGRGGMLSKLTAARLATNSGVDTYIAGGKDAQHLENIFVGHSSGTHCKPRRVERAMRNKARWIMVSRSSAASIQVDDGAVQALKKGKSLLAVGVRRIIGDFGPGESVEIVDMEKNGVGFGRADVSAKVLKATHFAEQKGVQVIHADNLVVF